MENHIAHARLAREAAHIVPAVALPVVGLEMARRIAARFSLPLESVCRLLGTPPADARRSDEPLPV